VIDLSKRKKRRQMKEEDTMAAAVKNYAYEVKADEGKKILEQPAVSKAFLKECREVAQKYRKKK
jgi:hypothetical protein